MDVFLVNCDSSRITWLRSTHQKQITDFLLKTLCLSGLWSLENTQARILQRFEMAKGLRLSQSRSDGRQLEVYRLQVRLAGWGCGGVGPFGRLLHQPRQLADLDNTGSHSCCFCGQVRGDSFADTSGGLVIRSNGSLRRYPSVSIRTYCVYLDSTASRESRHGEFSFFVSTTSMWTAVATWVLRYVIYRFYTHLRSQIEC